MLQLLPQPQARQEAPEKAVAISKLQSHLSAGNRILCLTLGIPSIRKGPRQIQPAVHHKAPVIAITIRFQRSHDILQVSPNLISYLVRATYAAISQRSAIGVAQVQETIRTRIFYLKIERAKRRKTRTVIHRMNGTEMRQKRRIVRMSGKESVRFHRRQKPISEEQPMTSHPAGACNRYGSQPPRLKPRSLLRRRRRIKITEKQPQQLPPRLLAHL